VRAGERTSGRAGGWKNGWLVYLVRIMFATIGNNRDLFSHLRLCIMSTYVRMYTKMQTVEFRPARSVILKKFKVNWLVEKRVQSITVEKANKEASKLNIATNR
jgi:hypothetical protein